jgi:outer membrane protein, adhesin transport system
VAQTVTQNPEVQARYHDFEASRSDQDAARGGFLPRIDASGRVGKAWRSAPGFPSGRFNNPEAQIELHQLLFDGFATSADVKRLGQVKASKYYDMLAKSDEIALETTRAYLDVKRYQELVQAAQANEAKHQTVLGKLQARKSAGLSPSYEPELARGRLALAQSNRITEESNLHDVGARYLRITNKLPANDLAAAPEKELLAAVPQADIIKTAVQRNPSYLSAVSGVRAARAAGDVARSQYSPTIEFKASDSVEKNYFGTPGNEKDAFVGLVFNWNLYRGGRDSHRVAQQKSLFLEAIDIREKTCRDIRQETAIAYNDTRKLSDQLRQLEAHLTASKDTYDRFEELWSTSRNVTLLNLLDEQNEYFQAQRAWINARYDLALAAARVLAQNHCILPALGVSKNAAEAPDEAAREGDEDMGPLCDAAMPQLTAAPLPPVPAASEPKTVPPPKDTAAPPVPPAEAKSGMEPDRLPGTEGLTMAACDARVRAWAESWSKKDYKHYVGFYSADFKPMKRRNLQDWESFRSKRLDKNYITVEVADLAVSEVPGKTCKAQFVQTYHSSDYSDRVVKTLLLRNESGNWHIMSEKSKPPKSASN